MRSKNWSTTVSSIKFLLYFLLFYSYLLPAAADQDLGFVCIYNWFLKRFIKKCVAVFKEEAEAQAGQWECRLRSVRGTLTLCVGSRLGVVLLTYVSGSWAGPWLMKVSFIQGQTSAKADLAILALMYSTWLTFLVHLALLGLTCQVLCLLLPILQAVQFYTHRVFFYSPL